MHPRTTRTDDFTIHNYGDIYYFPPKKLQTNLEEVIVFAENTKRNIDVPTGSIWKTNTNRYNPDILKADVGCGITRFDLPTYNGENLQEDITKILADQNISIGRGNHFIDFTTYQPFQQGDVGTNAMFLHSDMNPQQTQPTTYNAAKQREQNAANQRKETGSKLLQKLQLPHKETGDFPHNTVEQTGTGLLYRNGAINLHPNTNQSSEGILAVSPGQGILRYGANINEPIWKNLHYSMQHGVGKHGSQKLYYQDWPTAQKGKKQTYHIDKPNPRLNQQFRSLNEFRNVFSDAVIELGIYKPITVTRTD